MAKKTKTKSPAGRRSSKSATASATGAGISKKAEAAPWGSNETKDGSRGQRKRLKSKKRAESRKLVIEKVQKHFKVHKHGEALGDVSSLAKALEVFSKGKKSKVGVDGKVKGEAAVPVVATGAAKRMGNKRRAHLARAEVGLFKQVLAHPEFRANAVGAVQAHLRNSIIANKASQANQ